MKDLVQVIQDVEVEFKKVNTVNLPFHKETEFALQALENNQFLADVATKNKASFRNAIVNVAAVGLSLNPAHRLAYLLPRKVSGEFRVCLDFSYMGLTKIATDSGSILIVRAEVVYEKDVFKYQGPFTLPIFEPDCWAEDRGKKLGVWCAAKTEKGDYIVGFMSLNECYKIRDRSSESWKAHVKDKSKSSPWVTDEDEMIKKTIIKREYKLWPKTERLDNAIALINEHDGIDFKKELKDATAPTIELLEELKDKLKQAGKTEKALLASLPKHDCLSIDELNMDQVSHALKLINQFLENKNKTKETV